ncbi:hypothetical protein JVU11DRAFT_6391 [Chiua virens]|nr:hypothetical protein JVU11DRAFT_6391 [Chiua virens]
MDNHSRQPFIIDISDEEDEEETAQHVLDIGSNNSIEPSASPILASTPVLHPSPAQQSTTIGNVHTDTSLGRPQCEHDVDPPFMTDGRGRVVWSSTRNASGRATAAEGRASRHSRTGSTPRITCPSTNSTASISRGHGWGGQETRGIDGKVGGGDESSNMD